jgi:hypothetical protein
MKNFSPGQIKNKISLKNIPIVFEKFELIILLAGSIMIFTAVGFVLYGSVLAIIVFEPEASVELPSINQSLLESVVQDIENKERVYSDEPITDPFNPLGNSTTTIVEEQ